LELSKTTRKKDKPKKEKKSSGKRNKEDDIEELKMMEEERQNQILLSGFEQQLLDGILDEGSLANRQGCDRELADALLERASKENPRLVGYMKRGVAYHHAGLNNKGRVAVEALFRNRYIQVVFSTSTLGMSSYAEYFGMLSFFL
jgi:Lhr-like helicase